MILFLSPRGAEVYRFRGAKGAVFCVFYLLYTSEPHFAKHAIFWKKPCKWPLISQPRQTERGPSKNILTWKFLCNHQNDRHIMMICHVTVTILTSQFKTFWSNNQSQAWKPQNNAKCPKSAATQFSDLWPNQELAGVFFSGPGSRSKIR